MGASSQVVTAGAAMKKPVGKKIRATSPSPIAEVVVKPTVMPVLVTPGKGRVMANWVVVVVPCPVAIYMAWLVRVPVPADTMFMETRVASVVASVETMRNGPERIMVTSVPSNVGNLLNAEGVRMMVLVETDGVTRTCWPLETATPILNLLGVPTKDVPVGNTMVMRSVAAELKAAKEENTMVSVEHACHSRWF